MRPDVSFVALFRLCDTTARFQIKCALLADDLHLPQTPQISPAQRIR